MTRKSKEEVWECPICNERLGDGFRFGDHMMNHMQLKRPASQTPPQHDEGSAEWLKRFRKEIDELRDDPQAEGAGIGLDVAILLAERAAGTPSQHVHSFVIPVEWRTNAGGKAIGWGPDPQYSEVVKLRCSCGDEVER